MKQFPFLKTVKLERFKAAFQPPPIDLRNFTVIIGRNGSGKSTLLEALQWLDTTIRFDARKACDRYYGISDLINLRSAVDPAFFKFRLEWEAPHWPKELIYEVRVQQEKDGTPLVAKEQLWFQGYRSRLLSTDGDGIRTILPGVFRGRTVFSEPDRLALARGPVSGRFADPFEQVREFWAQAVFLRLSPNRLVAGSPAKRQSFAPLLDEEGQNLPALLHELKKEQRETLVEKLGEILQGIVGVRVDKPKRGHDVVVNYALSEKMPYQGRAGQSKFDIPSWMLSEGTRRITAILALLVHEPPPSLLCIEEIENGLDPVTVRLILAELKDAADRGVQVVLTTHSPWLLDDVTLQDIIKVERVGGNTEYSNFADRDEVRAFAGNVPPGTRYVETVGESE